MENGIPVSLNVSDWNRVLAFLSKMPFDQVADLMFSVRSQVETVIKHAAEQQKLADIPAPNGQQAKVN